MDEKKKMEYARRLMIARMTILMENGFFGLLLMHMKMAIDESISTAATDGERIYFSPKFLDSLTDEEVVFVLMHEIIHVALQHVYRDGPRNPHEFNIACDIVVNSNIIGSS